VKTKHEKKHSQLLSREKNGIGVVAECLHSDVRWIKVRSQRSRPPYVLIYYRDAASCKHWTLAKTQLTVALITKPLVATVFTCEVAKLFWICASFSFCFLLFECGDSLRVCCVRILDRKWECHFHIVLVSLHFPLCFSCLPVIISLFVIFLVFLLNIFRLILCLLWIWCFCLSRVPREKWWDIWNISDGNKLRDCLPHCW